MKNPTVVLAWTLIVLAGIGSFLLKAVVLQDFLEWFNLANITLLQSLGINFIAGYLLLPVIKDLQKKPDKTETESPLQKAWGNVFVNYGVTLLAWGCAWVWSSVL